MYTLTRVQTPPRILNGREYVREYSVVRGTEGSDSIIFSNDILGSPALSVFGISRRTIIDGRPSRRQVEINYLSFDGLGGNDTIIGSNTEDFFFKDAFGNFNIPENTDAGKDYLNGGTGSDFLIGGTNNDTLSGAAYGATVGGFGEIDTLVGGAGADTFIVSDNVNTPWYVGDGEAGYALIADFNGTELDRIILRNNYVLGYDRDFNSDGIVDTGIYYSPDGVVPTDLMAVAENAIVLPTDIVQLGSIFI